LSVSLFFMFNKNQVSLVAENSVIETTLPDNSQISLNVDSEIKYPKNFEENRTVELIGDAYFQVEHDSEHPFIVKTENYYVEVVGTEFYVSTKDNFEVTVNKGVVKVYPIKNNIDSVVLRAGDNVVQTSSNQILSTVDNQNYIAWKTGKIVFNNTSLSEIASILEKTYNISIEISNEEYKNLKMTATFDNQSVESILKVVEATMGVKVSKQGEKIIIY
jgi:transmembrane sensor